MASGISSGGITFSGLVSGLDTDSIISKLLSLQQKPINLLKAQQIVLGKRNDALNAINSKLLNVVNKLKPLLDLSTFNATKATSSDSTILTATSTASAALGTHSIVVSQLATATTRTSSGVIGTAVAPAALMNATTFKTVPSAGTFTLATSIGGTLTSATITIDPATQSLSDVITAINASAVGAPGGLTASYDAAGDRLVLTSADADPILLGSGSDTSNFLSATNLFTGTVVTGPPYSVASSPHLAGVRSSSVITSSSANFGTAVTAGTFFVNGVSITIDGTTDTLDSVINKINASAAGVTASFDPIADRVALSSKNLGNTTITVANGTSNFVTAARLDTATQVTGLQSQATVDGTTYFRNTNSPTDILNGITLNFLKTSATTVTLTIDRDTSVANNAISTFVTAFNESETEIFNQTKVPVFDGTKQKAQGGPLTGEFLVRDVATQMERLAIDEVPGLSDTLDSLADIGITLTRTAGQPLQLSIDTSKLSQSLAAGSGQVASLFTSNVGSTVGVAVRLNNFLGPVTSSTDNSGIPGIVSGNNAVKTQLDDRIKTLEDRMKAEEERLRKQFADLEVTLAKLQQQSQALTSQLSLLSALSASAASKSSASSFGIG